MAGAASEVRSLTCLADYDNCRVLLDRSEFDTEVNLESIAGCAARLASAHYPNLTEIALWLYSGWLDQRGRETATCSWAYAKLTSIRRRFGGVAVLPSIRLSIASAPRNQLIGTYRERRSPERGGQKMVDTMVCMDLLHIASHEQHVLLMSDDDDMLPAVLQLSATTAGQLVLCRHRARGLNDAHLAGCNGVLLTTMGLR
jgi:hypothetical protein